MATTKKTMIHPGTGAVLRRGRRTETVAYMGSKRRVTVDGWFPEDGGDGILVGTDSKPLDAALAALKREYGVSAGKLAKQVRNSVGMSQEDASLLLTGSPNSFYKYENGAARPSWPTFVLLKLLAREPKLIKTIKTA